MALEYKLVLFLVLLLQCFSFRIVRNQAPKYALKYLAATTLTDERTWQEGVDEILNVDTPCQTRVDTVSELLKKREKVIEDISEAIKEKNFTKVAPPNLGM